MEYGFLIAAVIRCGLKDDGLDYLQTPGGQYWCLLGNVDPEVVRERAEATSPDSRFKRRPIASRTPYGILMAQVYSCYDRRAPPDYRIERPGFHDQAHR